MHDIILMLSVGAHAGVLNMHTYTISLACLVSCTLITEECNIFFMSVYVVHFMHHLVAAACH